MFVVRLIHLRYIQQFQSILLYFLGLELTIFIFSSSNDAGMLERAVFSVLFLSPHRHTLLFHFTRIKNNYNNNETRTTATKTKTTKKNIRKKLDLKNAF